MREQHEETVSEVLSEWRKYGDRPPPRNAWIDMPDRLDAALAREADKRREWTDEIDSIICGIDCMSSSDIDAVRLYLDRINGDEDEF